MRCFVVAAFMEDGDQDERRYDKPEELSTHDITKPTRVITKPTREGAALGGSGHDLVDVDLCRVRDFDARC